MTKEKCRTLTRKAILSGHLVVSTCCEECGTIKGLCVHHKDYRDHMDVSILCRHCHRILHIRNRHILSPVESSRFNFRISMTKDSTDRLKALSKKMGLSTSATVVQALRALEEKEAARDREVNQK